MITSDKKRVVSGITSSSLPTIANYLGAVKRWVKDQDTQENFFFIANSHAITVRQNPKELYSNTLDSYAWLMACGLDADKNTIFVQSMVPAHAELAWILNNYTTMGELERMTQYKDKSARFGEEGQLLGLFSYPVLMAADILLYSPDEVPTGDDQKQHIELTRNIAERFNNLYGETFTVPKPAIADSAARVMNLADPSKKMSKSDPGPGTIYLDESPDDVRSKLRRAVTDSDNQVVYDKPKKPAIANLMEIYGEFSGKSIEHVETQYKDEGYGVFKQDLSELVADKLTQLQASYKKIRSNETQLMQIVEQGNAKAQSIANKKLQEVKEKVGLL